MMNNFFRNKLKNYEVPHNENAWSEFQAYKISHQNVKFSAKTFGLVSLVSAVLIGFVGVALNLNNPQILEETENVEIIISENDNVIAENNTIKVSSVNEILESNKSTESKIKIDENNSTIESNNEIDNNNNSPENTDNQIQQEDTVVNIETEDYQSINENEQKFDISSLSFEYKIIENCLPVKAEFFAYNLPDNYKIEWNFGNNKSSNSKNPVCKYSRARIYYPQVKVYSNDDKLVKTENLEPLSLEKNPIKNFTYKQNENLFKFSAEIVENCTYTWKIDNKTLDGNKAEYEFSSTGTFKVVLIVANNNSCTEIIEKNVYSEVEHVFFVPNAFRPSSNGVNSSFGPIGDNLSKYSYKMIISDKNRNLVFSTNDIANPWNGRMNNIGSILPEGLYFYEIITIDKFGNKKLKKGQLNLLAN